MRLPKHLSKTKIAVIFSACLILGLLFFFTLPPLDFPANKIVTIASGSSLTEAGKFLEKAGIIRSSFLFDNVMILLNREHGVISGEYVFTQPLGVFAIANRISRGDFGFPLKIVTIPEGMTIQEMSNLMPKDFFHFDKSLFKKLADGKEGYLFPDTYYFSTNIQTADVIKTLSENFDKKTETVKGETLTSKHSWSDSIIMASILEEEAKTTTDREMVAGILWKRLKLGMKLQIDPPLTYVLGRNTFQLTLKDLKNPSPYNTYVHTGLPPTPISNPGLNTIEAALNPTDSKYFFYLSDKNGVMHYAETFAGHQKNINLYLK